MMSCGILGMLVDPATTKTGEMLMEMRFKACGVLLLTGCWLYFAHASVAADAEQLARFSLDDATAIQTVISTDNRIKTEGSGAIKVATAWPTAICLAQVDGLKVDNATLMYVAQVKADNLNGNAYLEMWCRVNGGEYFSRGLDSVVSGSSEWQTLKTPFLLKPGQKADKVTLNLVVNGSGTVWIDDVRLLKSPLP